MRRERLKTLCPTLGKVKIAQILARAGLHLGATTVGRILREHPALPPKQCDTEKPAGRAVAAYYPNHVWSIDLTTVATGSGFWCSWLPWALPQRWPFCWWVAVIIDHFSRRVMNIGIFARHPDCRALCALLGQTIRKTTVGPKYIVCDRDSIFDCGAFRRYSQRRGIRPPRYGAVGRHGSVAVVERFILTMKTQCVRQVVVSQRHKVFRSQLTSFLAWYNDHRPHMRLGGRTPNEVYFSQRPANRRPRIEPRRHWPRRSRCARPQTLVAGQPGDRFTLQVGHLNRQQHLPIVTLRRVA
jgi:transposase InsO family protein